MLRKLTLLLVGLSLIVPLSGQAQPDSLWLAWFDGDHTEDWGMALSATNDGGFVILGRTPDESSTYNDMLLVKTDADGNEIWRQTYGAHIDEYGWDVRETSDGNLVLGGWSNSYSEYFDAFVVLTDAAGNQLWQRTYDIHIDDRIRSIRQTPDGGFIFTGNDGGIEFIGGGSSILHDSDIFLVKTDPDGITEWARTFGSDSSEVGYCVQNTTDGGYVIAAGWQPELSDTREFSVIKTDDLGNLEWNTILNNQFSDEAFWVEQTDDGGYVAAGYVGTQDPWVQHIYVVKLDDGGNVVWDRIVEEQLAAHANCIRLDPDGGYVVCCGSMQNGEGALVKLDSQGNTQWVRNIQNDQYVEPYQMEILGPDEYILGGTAIGYGWFTYNDLFLFRMGEGVGVRPNPQTTRPAKVTLGEAYPNPFNAEVTVPFAMPRADHIVIDVFNVTGRRVASLIDRNIGPGSFTATWNAKAAPAGIYFIRLMVGETQALQKIALVK